MIIPAQWETINLLEGTIIPNDIVQNTNSTFWYWVHSLSQRACSPFKLKIPKSWYKSKGLLYELLIMRSYAMVFKSPKYGYVFAPCTIGGRNIMYAPLKAFPQLPTDNTEDLKEMLIGEECELIRFSPDYKGFGDVIVKYAILLSAIDCGIEIAIDNSKLAWIIGVTSEAMAETVKKLFDKAVSGARIVTFDKELLKKNPNFKGEDNFDSLKIFDRSNVKECYLTPQMLQDEQTILNLFDSEIGIPSLPYQKKERMVSDEANSKIIDSQARFELCFDTLQESIEEINALFPDINLSCSKRWNNDSVSLSDTSIEEGGEE